MDTLKIRKAEKGDISTLNKLLIRSLSLESKRDPLFCVQGDDLSLFLKGVLENPHSIFYVVEIKENIEGYILGFIQNVVGPTPPPIPKWKKIFAKKKPFRPVVSPFKAIWIEDIFVTKKARKLDCARLFANLIRDIAIKEKAKRIGGSISVENIPARAFAESLGMKPTRYIYTVDLNINSKIPEIPKKRSKKKMKEKDPNMEKKQQEKQKHKKEFIPPTIEAQEEWNIRSRTAGFGGTGQIIGPWGNWRGHGCGGS